jgi:type IV pilus assembly protein PilB
VLVQAGLPQDQLSSDNVTLYGPVGCDQCHKGFAGRTGIFQVMPVSAEMQNLVLRDAGIQELALQAQREGVATLRQAGLRKVLQGITSLEEVLAATRDGA